MTVYQPVMNVATQMWMLGVIERHTARNLTRDELDEVCAVLNDPKVHLQAEVAALRARLEALAVKVGQVP